ncbi:MAG: DEAD/DEAH box helicase [Candidatus Aminicenantes bacterium]|nr:DEAD/DEAH box helicase [Candidatus Aminicenantes bacterium]MDH5383535.1 DEAD/DEAH box helicase [Candidatus Aminicenantes bacterium]MDH5743008.1 DEAD/DEAH box helicase [Candidatus Aminicenantes bacterium]
MEFNEFKLEPRLLQGIANRGYKKMTAVQEQTLAKTLQGMDVAVQSQTGTGKTAAFLITLFERMLYDRASKRKKALVIVPTRELAVQIEKEARLLNRHLGFAIGSFYGGVGYNGQLALLKRGLDIIIGTPGRLLDLSQKGHLKLKSIGILVIDEADRLFDMGFLPDIKKILQRMPPRYARQNMLFSATLSRVSRTIAAEHMNRPVFIEVTPEQLTVDTISQELYHVKSHIKMNLMLGILKTQAPQNALIFTNMRHSAFRLAKKLQQNGFRSRHLTGDLPQSQRLKIIDDFMAGKFAFLVATDVAARGLHIDDLEMVINYDIPQDCENYVHRIGRTARAGNSGKAISLASEGTADHLEAIESFISMKIPVQTADDDLYATDMSLGFRSKNTQRKKNHGRSRLYAV